MNDTVEVVNFKVIKRVLCKMLFLDPIENKSVEDFEAIMESVKRRDKFIIWSHHYSYIYAGICKHFKCSETQVLVDYMHWKGSDIDNINLTDAKKVIIEDIIEDLTQDIYDSTDLYKDINEYEDFIELNSEKYNKDLYIAIKSHFR